MRRVKAFCVWKQEWWRCQGSRRDSVSKELAGGLSAYAHRQVSTWKSLHDNFAYLWRMSDELILVGDYTSLAIGSNNPADDNDDDDDDDVES
jgi:hypothetical protein